MEGRKRKERVSPLCIFGEGERGKWRGAFAPTPRKPENQTSCMVAVTERRSTLEKLMYRSPTRLRAHKADRKPRTPFTTHQLVCLEATYCRQPYLSATQRCHLATSLQLSETQVGYCQRRNATIRGPRHFLTSGPLRSDLK